MPSPPKPPTPGVCWRRSKPRWRAAWPSCSIATRSGDVARRHEQASELVALCRRFDVPLIVNDDLRLADLADADGVHLGRDDGSLREARIMLGADKFIGVSCYQSLELALAAQAPGRIMSPSAAFFPSPTKPAAGRADAALLHAATQAFAIPIVAIGGITLDQCARFDRSRRRQPSPCCPPCSMRPTSEPRRTISINYLKPNLKS